MKTVTIFGGGPSINDLEITQERFPEVIAVNNAWEIVPWAKILYASDEEWWHNEDGWGNRDKVLANFKGRILVDEDCVRLGKVPADRVETRKRMGINYDHIDDPSCATGPCSGTKAMSVAYHEGYKRIQLAGFDSSCDAAGRTHYHNAHPPGRLTNTWESWIRDGHRNIGKLLMARGVKIVRITKPGTTLFPYEPVD